MAHEKVATGNLKTRQTAGRGCRLRLMQAKSCWYHPSYQFVGSLASQDQTPRDNLGMLSARLPHFSPDRRTRVHRPRWYHH